MQQFFTVDSAQFEQFCKRAQHWQQRLGLGDWVCTAMVHADSTLDDASLAGANAMISLLVDGHSFRLTCNTQWSIPVNEPNLNYVCLHEMMHLVFADVWELAYKACHPALNEQLSKLEHAAIARLTNAFAPAHIRIVQPELITLRDAAGREAG